MTPPPPPRLNRVVYVVVGAAALAMIGVAYLIREGPRPAVVTPESAPSTPPQPVAKAPAPAEPVIQHPIEPAPPDATDRSLADLLNELFGRATVTSLLQVDDFPRRFVATVDNLGRAQASSKLWPVNPAGGRFHVEPRDGGAVIAADNAARYAPYVKMLETVDLRQAVQVYKRVYPELQRAYEDLGYSKRYFNDRLVEVIDQLLATPDLAAPAAVHLPDINGPVRPTRPWVLYEYDDPMLQSLSAGQKMLLRAGPDHERRIKARLRELRRLVTAR